MTDINSLHKSPHKVEVTDPGRQLIIHLTIHQQEHGTDESWSCSFHVFL